MGARFLNQGKHTKLLGLSLTTRQKPMYIQGLNLCPCLPSKHLICFVYLRHLVGLMYSISYRGYSKSRTRKGCNVHLVLRAYEHTSTLGAVRVLGVDYRGTSLIRNRHPLAGPPQGLLQGPNGAQFLMSEVPL